MVPFNHSDAKSVPSSVILLYHSMIAAWKTCECACAWMCVHVQCWVGWHILLAIKQHNAQNAHQTDTPNKVTRQGDKGDKKH